MMLKKWLWLGALLALPSVAYAQGANVVMGVGATPTSPLGTGPVAGLYSYGAIMHGPGFQVIEHGPVTLSNQSVNMDAFILQYGTAISMGSSDSRNQNYPALNLATVLVPSAATMLIGVDSIDPWASVMGTNDAFAWSDADVRCRKNVGSGPDSFEYVNDGTGFCFVYASGLASGIGNASVGALTTWNNTPVLNFNVNHSDPTYFPPGAIVTGFNPQYPIPLYMTATPFGDVTTILTAPLGSMTASFGSPAYNNQPATWVVSGDRIFPRVHAGDVGTAPLGFTLPGGPIIEFHSYTTNTSVQTVTTVTDWTKECYPPPEVPPAGIPGNLTCGCNPNLYAGGASGSGGTGGGPGGGTGGGGLGGN